MLRRLIAMCLATVAATVLLSGCTSSEATSAQPTENRFGYSNGVARAEWESRGTTFESVEKAAGEAKYELAQLPEIPGRDYHGAILLDRLDPAGEILPEDSRPVFQFVDGVRFEQWPYASAEEAERIVRAADTNKASGVATAREAKVNGLFAIVEDASVPTDSLDGSGEPSGAFVPLSSVIWAKGSTVFALRGDGVSVEELLKIAEAVDTPGSTATR